MGSERCALAAALAALALLAAAGCEPDDTLSCDGDPPGLARPDNWSRASHCRGAAPDYDEVFDDAELHELRITISAADRDATIADLEAIQAAAAEIEDLDALPAPIWVPATVEYRGRRWTQVAMRYKGHASLIGALSQGFLKLSFLLDFDGFEEAYPELADQRFWGFKRLVFSNSYNDPSLIREKAAAEVFRAAGVPVARSAFAPVTLDWGEGPVYLGLYTVIEDPADAMLEAQFGRHEGGVGNLYKPWGDAARWLAPPSADADAGALDLWEEEIARHFEKETNEEGADWSDVERLIDKLHRDRDVAAQWRADLEEAFDVRGFLRALAVNQLIVNWDSYGCMHHNYYLYADPLAGGRFTWFPWDMNEAMLYPGGVPSDCTAAPGSVFLDEVLAEDAAATGWPVIRFVLADPVYRAQYEEELRAALDAAFDPETVIAALRRYHDLVAPWVVGPDGVEAYRYWACGDVDLRFPTSLTDEDEGLEPHVWARRDAVAAALAE